MKEKIVHVNTRNVMRLYKTRVTFAIGRTLCHQQFNCHKLWHEVLYLHLRKKSTVLHQLKRILYFVDSASCYDSWQMTNLTHNSILCIYFNSLHVSSNLVLIIRRTKYINTTSGICHAVSVTVSCAVPANRTHNPQLHARPTTCKPERQVP